MNTPNMVEDLEKLGYSFTGDNFTHEYVPKNNIKRSKNNILEIHLNIGNELKH